MRPIDADELKKEMESSKYIIPNDLNRLLNSEINRCIEAIDNAPTVETDIKVVAKDAYEHGYTDGWKERFGEPEERPKGEWIRSEETFEDLSGSFETYTRSTCSVCNQANGWGEVPYCPWCGARMEKRDDQHRETDQEQRG